MNSKTQENSTIQKLCIDEHMNCELSYFSRFNLWKLQKVTKINHFLFCCVRWGGDFANILQKNEGEISKNWKKRLHFQQKELKRLSIYFIYEIISWIESILAQYQIWPDPISNSMNKSQKYINPLLNNWLILFCTLFCFSLIRVSSIIYE